MVNKYGEELVINDEDLFILGTMYTCPACNHKSRGDTICDNLFAADENAANGLFSHCSNCEEGNVADWFVEI